MPSFYGTSLKFLRGEVEELGQGDEHPHDPDGHGDEDGGGATHARRQRPDDGVVPAEKNISDISHKFEAVFYSVRLKTHEQL